MVTVELPDGNKIEFESPVSALQVAERISPRLAKSAIAARIDGTVRDLTHVLDEGPHAVVVIIDRDEEAAEILRHTAAHVLAQAMVNLFGAGVKYTIGPALTEDFQYGYYYDFDMPSPVGAEDLPKIEAEMRRIAAQKLPIERVELPVDEAIAQMRKLGQDYKVEMIQDLVRTQQVKTVSLYRQGDFIDMCRGPHLPHTGFVKAVALLSAAGAYWRGDERNKMLTRVYGCAFFDDKSLKEHLANIEEAKKRDHRTLGKQLDLFLISDDVGPGLPLWMPKGATLRMQLMNWLQGELIARGYQIVATPHIGRLGLYRTSGHYPYYKESQFPPIEMDGEDAYLIKPMNCPHHITIYKARQHSYRDLPLRLAEFGTVYRFEQSGELNGLTRVRGFTQDDAHIICTQEQLESEIESCVDLVKLVLETLGLTDYRVRLGLRDPNSDKYAGDAEHWALAEQNIRNVVRKLGMSYTEGIGDAVFYGPKIDFVVRDCLGRQWQLGTIQVDYNLPQRFSMEYIGEDNRPHQPVMIHRAPFGSLERFIGILIEHFGGAFPLWLSPVQVAVLPVSEKVSEYADKVYAELKRRGIRVEMDSSPEKIGAKIRRSSMDKIPYMAIVGQNEAAAGAVSLRGRGGVDHGVMPLDAMIAKLLDEISTRSLGQ